MIVDKFSIYGLFKVSSSVVRSGKSIECKFIPDDPLLKPIFENARIYIKQAHFHEMLQRFGWPPDNNMSYGLFEVAHHTKQAKQAKQSNNVIFCSGTISGSLASASFSYQPSQFNKAASWFYLRRIS